MIYVKKNKLKYYPRLIIGENDSANENIVESKD